MHPILQQVLNSRGRDPEFLNYRLTSVVPPAGNPRFDTAVSALVDAIAQGLIVGVYGDYDADGTTAAAVTTTFLRRYGLDVLTMTSRRGDGYGFSARGVELSERVQLLIIYDCGSRDLETVGAAAENCPVVVVDHHNVPPGDPADHPAILVNPRAEPGAWPFAGYCSAGLSWLLCSEVARRRGDRLPLDLLDLAAVGTVADVVPLVGANRAIVGLGLRRMNQGLRAPFKAVAHAAMVEGALDEITIGWKFGPRLNSPGRIGDAQITLDLLTAETWDDAVLAASRVEAANTLRRQLLDEGMAGIVGKVVDLGWCVVVRGSWTGGIAGIIAGRLAAEHGKPAFAASGTRKISGSARGRNGVTVFGALKAAESLLATWGGHHLAAGFSLRANDWDAFLQSLRDHKPAVLETVETDTIALDADGINIEMARAVAQLKPFGEGNPEPLFRVLDIEVVSKRAIGAERKHAKISCRTASGHIFDALAWGMGDLKTRAGKRCDLTGHVQINRWNGDEKVQFVVTSFDAR
jgi:single-stranded-DNA-specific exonuclease